MAVRRYDPALDDAALHRCELDFEYNGAPGLTGLRGKVLTCRVPRCRSFHRYDLVDCARPSDVLLELHVLGLLIGKARAEAARLVRDGAGRTEA